MRLEIETYCNVYMWDQLQLIHGPALFDSFSVLTKTFNDFHCTSYVSWADNSRGGVLNFRNLCIDNSIINKNSYKAFIYVLEAFPLDRGGHPEDASPWRGISLMQQEENFIDNSNTGFIILESLT